MKNKNGIYIIGVDHGYGNIKTANCCFPTGVESNDTELYCDSHSEIALL